MPTLQIRDLPDDVLRGIATAARAEQRSLARQAVVELRRALDAGHPDRRRATVEALRAAGRRLPKGAPVPEDLVRADRDERRPRSCSTHRPRCGR